MTRINSRAIAFAAAASISSVAWADTLVLNPVSDGSLYTCAGCNVVSEGTAIVVSGYIQGAVKFSSDAITGTVSQALLTLSPRALPLYGPLVDIYGYGTDLGQLDVSDANAGNFIGTYSLPEGLGFGEDATFDVTSFVAATRGPYLAFNIRSTGTDVFNSLEENFGHPAQLLILTAVPEIPTATMLLPGIAGLVVLLRRRTRAGTAP